MLEEKGSSSSSSSRIENQDSGSSSSSNDVPYGYVFGYGSIINLHSRVRSGGSATAIYVRISKKFGYVRKWNFRSPTGFTALGLCKNIKKQSTVNGVLFACTEDQMRSFDERESGYTRVRIPFEYVNILEKKNKVNIVKNVPIHVYVPPKNMCSKASEKYPICQTYIDCVLSGLLDIGGKDAVTEFIHTTFDWTSFYLYDTPMSRRPWLHRGAQYKKIDEMLEKNDLVTFFRERRHPPEYAHLCSLAIRGIWGVPSRNAMFYGRDQLMSVVHTRLCRHKNTGIGILVLAGLGGVGKTQLAIEYCHRQYASKAYGLVLWIRAESHATVARDFRSFATDFGIDRSDGVDDEKAFVRGVCKKLCNSTTPWLIVFDNIGSDFDLSTCIPRGAQNGCVLCTSRVMLDKKPWHGNCMAMECFSLSESREFLKLATCPSRNEKEFEMGGAADMLALELGNLPLAVALAACKMRKCDIGCEEYLAAYRTQRLAFFEYGGATLQNYAPRGIAGTLAMSLQWIQNESKTCRLILNSMCFLSPDNITRCMIRELLKILQSEKLKISNKQKSSSVAVLSESSSSSSSNFFSKLFSFLFIPLCDSDVVCPHSSNSSSPVNEEKKQDMLMKAWTPYVMSEGVKLETSLDMCWSLLKSSCFLAVRRGRKSGSMHRLLQQLLRSKLLAEENESFGISIRRCVLACKNVWCFNSCDSNTWDACGEVVMHISALAKYVNSASFSKYVSTNHTILNELASLLLFASEYESVARSRFEESLSLAVHALQVVSLQENGPIETWRSSRKACAALCQIGKILRYQDRLELSCACVSRAMNVLEKLKPCLENELELVSTLHELGLVQTKLRKLDSANRNLNRALDMKRHLQSANHENVSISSTLYALARVLSLCKPAQLERSEILLLQSLELERNAVARASTYQMLARVTLRQGGVESKETAQKYLNEALRLHKSVYDNECHVNIASVRHQLGCLYAQTSCTSSSSSSSSSSMNSSSPSRKRKKSRDLHEIDFANAATHFEAALRIRRRVYGNQPHFDISKSLYALGLMEIRRENYGKAQAYLEEQMSCLKELLRRYDAASPVLSTTWSPRYSPRNCQTSNGNNNTLDELDNFQLPPSSIPISPKKEISRTRKIPSPKLLTKKFSNKNSDDLNDMLFKCGMKCLGINRGPMVTNMSDESPISFHSSNRALYSLIMCMESLRSIAKRQDRKCSVQHLTKEIQIVRKHVRTIEEESEDDESDSICCKYSVVSRSIRSTVMVLCKTRNFVRSELIRSCGKEGFSKWTALLQNAQDSVNRHIKMSCPAEIRVVHKSQKLRNDLLDAMSVFMKKISLDNVDASRYEQYLCESKGTLFRACDDLRAVFRAYGFEINDL